MSLFDAGTRSKRVTGLEKAFIVVGGLSLKGAHWNQTSIAIAIRRRLPYDSRPLMIGWYLRLVAGVVRLRLAALNSHEFSYQTDTPPKLGAERTD
jgi:hypothetical protein